jgi:hypothetical protein
MAVPIISKFSQKALTPSGDGLAIVAVPFTAWDRQMWTAEPLGAGIFRIVNLWSGKVLDIAHASKAEQAPVCPWDWHGGPNQRFRLAPIGPAGLHEIIAVHSGKHLQWKGQQFPDETAPVPDGTPLVQSNDSGQYQFRVFSGPIISIQDNQQLFMDVSGGSTADGAAVVQWTPHLGGNQLFWLNYVKRTAPPFNVIEIATAHSGKVLDIEGGSKEQGARLVQWGRHGGANQLFRISPFKGRYLIMPLHSDKHLHVAGGSKAAGAAIVQGPPAFNISSNRWVF